MMQIALELIDANPYQPRQGEDPEAVIELARSIERNGLMQIPTARTTSAGEPGDVRYELAFGHTRLAAYKLLAGEGKAFERMPLNIADLSDLQMFELGVGENIKRRDLNAIEQALAMRHYLDDFGKTSEETAEFFNVSAETVRGKVRFLNLDPVIQDKMRKGEINEADARKLLTVQRIAPKEAASIGKHMGQAMAGTLDDAIRDVFHNPDQKKSVVEMWGRYHDASDGKARGGENLWPLDWKHTGLPAISDREALKILGTDFAQPGLINALAAGMIVSPDQYPLLDPNHVETLIQLSNPPACTSCPLHAIVDGAHYCGERRCHARKKTAWLNKDLKAISKKLGIAIYDPETDIKPFDVYESTYGDDAIFKKRVNEKDINLRIMVRRLNEYREYPATEHHWIAVVDLSEARKKAIEKQKVAGKAKKAKEPSVEERQKQWRREIKLREASDAFIEKVAAPAFADAFAGFKNIPALLALLDNGDIESGFKKLKDAEKIKRLQLFMADQALDNGIDWNLKEKGLSAVAKHLQGVATTWGVKLPKDWLEKAAEWDAEIKRDEE